MAHISSIDSTLSEEEQKTVQEALEELNTQLVLYESLETGPEHAEDERRQASKVLRAMRKLACAPMHVQTKAYYQEKLQVGRFSRADSKERRVQTNSLLKELALVTKSHENSGLETKVATPVEKAWKLALDELNEQLVLYGRLGQAPEQEPERAKQEQEQAAKVVVAMHKVSDAHTDLKVKDEYQRKAENFEKASPGERRNELNGLLKGLLVLLATPFALVGAVIFAAGSILYGVGSIVKGLGTVITGGLFD